ncbi:TraX family protein [Kushneria aurantia]|uniref:TraX family protein n=1 Tax=Kushneria aurantia TaxID=504092 RepID=A0ABV6G3E6_9GAMM|nr:TraX family protein [Kushneria aurantia]
MTDTATATSSHHNRMARAPSHWTDWGKWLALISMTTDHVVRYALSNELSWQLSWASSTIGRVAFPLFAAMVAWHGLFDTRNPLRYARRILVIGVIAQLPYVMMPRFTSVIMINVCFTLTLGLLLGSWFCHVYRLPAGELRRRLVHTAGASALLLALYLLVPLLERYNMRLEYGFFGVLMVPTFMLAMACYRHFDSGVVRIWAWLAGLPVLWITAQLNYYSVSKSIAFATSLAVLLLAAGLASVTPRLPRALKMPRWLWLGWYPGHLAIIALIVYLPFWLANG